MDWVALAEQAALRTPEAFEAAGEAVGVTLDDATFARLTELGKLGGYHEGIGVPRLLAILARVQSDPGGLVWECIEQRPSFVHVLAVRVTDGPNTWVAIDAARTRRKSPAEPWPELAPWKRKLADNGDRCRAWAMGPKRCRLPARAVAKVAPTPKAKADDAGLLAAVIANPDDDAARLIYADWLEEQGDGRAALIRKQLTLAQTTDWQKHRVLEAEIMALLEAGWKDWAGVAAKYTSAKGFARGFVDSVSMTVPAFEKHGLEVFTKEPVRRLHLKDRTWTPKDLQRLAAAPAMQHVRALSINQVEPGSNPLSLEALADGPGFPKLEVLSFGACGHTPRDWQNLFERIRAPKLRELHTHYNRTCAAIYAGLARNQTLTAFALIDEYAYTSLDLGTKAEALLDQGVGELAAVRPSFASWTANSAHITDRVAGHLYGPKSAVAMQKLELNNAPGLTNAFAEAIAASPKAKALKKFATHNSRVHLKGAVALLRAAENLTEFRLNCFDVGVWTPSEWEALGQALLDVPKDRPLKKIELRGSSGVGAAIAEQLKARYGRWDV